MTASSKHTGIVHFDASLYRRGDDPLDTALVKDGSANGILHKADSFSQCRVNWQPVNPDVTIATSDPSRVAYAYLGTLHEDYGYGSPISGARFQAFFGCPFGLIDLPIHSDGTPYHLRLYVAMGISSASNGSTPPPQTSAPGGDPALVDLRVFLYKPMGPDYLTDFQTQMEAEQDWVWQASCGVSGSGATNILDETGGWLTGATRGSGAYPTKLVVSADQAAEWAADYFCATGADGAASRLPRQSLVRVGVGVAARTNSVPTQEQGSGTSLPTLYPVLRALHIQGFVG